MKDPTPIERLQPALLDRLTDLDPTRSQEAREQRLLGRNQLRDAVLRDLGWLLNSTRPNDIDAADRPNVRRSVLAYGLPALSGTTASSLDVRSLEAQVRQVIIDFEPRIVPNTLEVQAQLADNVLDSHNVLSFSIRGQLWSVPVPLEMLLRTEVDLESGQVQIEDLTR
ncbi:type VI secretion system baseplate subunit TssE [Derxia gummosa]|uniref:Type VI secretion system baseplate subunit TssE n=1 Tax=Derxia gummosa DSM 723 TaxID=1121388 RepID=A0A8B6X2G1_9BURK|nr:type VI secretion system baseplate subunit TssE [Derxia gummosa]